MKNNKLLKKQLTLLNFWYIGPDLGIPLTLAMQLSIYIVTGYHFSYFLTNIRQGLY